MIIFILVLDYFFMKNGKAGNRSEQTAVMAKVIIKMKQRFSVIHFSSFLSKTFRVALIIHYLPFKH